MSEPSDTLRPADADKHYGFPSELCPECKNRARERFEAMHGKGAYMVGGAISPGETPTHRSV